MGEVVVVEAVAGVAQLECVLQVQVEITEEEPLMIGGATKIFEPLFIWSEKLFGPSASSLGWPSSPTVVVLSARAKC